MAPAATLSSVAAQVQHAPANPNRRPTARHRPVSGRIHGRSQSSTKLATAALALTQAHTETASLADESKGRRRTKSVEDMTLLRPHGSTTSLSRPRPGSRLSSKRPLPRDESAEGTAKVAGGGDEEEWMSESGASSSPTQAPERGDLEDEEEYDGPQIRIGTHTHIHDSEPSARPRSPRVQQSAADNHSKTSAEQPGLTIQTAFPSLPSPGPSSAKAIYRAPRSPHTPARLRPMSLIRPPSFASAVVTAPPILDKQTVLSGPDSPASELLPDSPKPASSAHEPAPSIAPSMASVVPSRVRTISAMSGASAAASRAMDALSRANANPFLTSHFPHLPPQEHVHHLLPSKFIASHMTVKRHWTPVDDAIARIRPSTKAA